MSTPNLHQSTTLADLARLVERVNLKSPELSTRAISGATLVLTGAVTPDPESGPTAYRVNGSKAEPYAVDLAGEPGCDCPDATKRGVQFKNRTYCKHQLAALFYRRLSELVAERRPSRRFARLQTYRPQRTARPERVAVAA
jgi:hypothetical protein